MAPADRGALIVFEGCDRVGKTTQTKLLLERMKKSGNKGEIIVFPDRSTDLGKFIDQYLKGKVEMEAKEAHLVFAANRQAVVEKMKKKLFDGYNLIADRYAYSGIAYTLAKRSMNMGLEWAKLQDVGILKPDCVVFFDLPPEEVSFRSGFGEERLEAMDLQRRVYEVMKKLGNENKDIWKSVDAALPIDVLANEIWKVVEPITKAATSNPLRLIDTTPPLCLPFGL